MSQGETQRVKKGLGHLFKAETNPMMKEFKPRSDDWNDWLILQEA
jgi:hypothetical protein